MCGFFFLTDFLQIKLTFWLHPTLNSPFVTSFFLIQVTAFLSEVNGYQIYMASMDEFGFARACDKRSSYMCDGSIALTHYQQCSVDAECPPENTQYLNGFSVSVGSLM